MVMDQMEETQNCSGMEISEQDICTLLIHFSKHSYYVPNNFKEPRNYNVDVLKLLERDYIIKRLNNEDGSMCPQYPSIIPIIESARCVTTIYENEDEATSSNLNIEDIQNLICGASVARCRQRFPVPVIFLNGKYVCRSSTLSTKGEMCLRSGLIHLPEFILLGGLKELWYPPEEEEDDVWMVIDTLSEESIEETPETEDIPDTNPEELIEKIDLITDKLEDEKVQTLCDKSRELDVKLLKCYNVNAIVDIMVEKRKVKYTLKVSSSEKVEKLGYEDFKLISLPYPGCEFFKEFYDASLNPEGLVYKWDDPANDAEIDLPRDSIFKSLPIPWLEYKEWDLKLITQNYLKYILKRLQDDNSGVLLHCISGWDRTPLFMSLIRLSLWADNLIHVSLNESEMLYFTLVYDWYLFGHQLSNRLRKNEEIMTFCFDFLRYITSEEFSLKSRKKYSDDIKTDGSRSPSSNSSASAEDNTFKKKRPLPADFLLMETNENSNDSTNMDIAYENSNSPPEATADSASLSNGAVPEGEAMDTISEEDVSRYKGLSSLSQGSKRHSPIPVGMPGRRQRSESTGSNSSSLSSNWQMISDCGSIEKDITFKPPRYQKLEKVRTLFHSCYQKTVKNSSFGPPQKGFVENIVGSLASWYQWNSLYGQTPIDNLTDPMETNGNAGNTENGDTITEANVNSSQTNNGDIKAESNGNINGDTTTKTKEIADKAKCGVTNTETNCNTNGVGNEDSDVAENEKFLK